MRNLKLVLAYDGTKYHGFQIQNKTHLKTIQGTLERALCTLTQEEIAVIGSGRTDAGVHARGQVVNFHSTTCIPAERLPLAVNSLLPPDIVVLAAEDVPEDFHARFDAQRKTYCYTIYNRRMMDPFWRYYAYHVPIFLDTLEMGRACQLFEGSHDFSGFCARDTAVKNYVRTIYACSLQKEENLLKFTVTGNGFLYNMVRIMGGTLLEVGKGKVKAAEITELLQTGDRTLAGMTLPPQGLCLLSVEY
jgi:tRNA pseudouridine38-40 synthase